MAIRHDLKTPLPPFDHVPPQGEKVTTPRGPWHFHLMRLPWFGTLRPSGLPTALAMVIVMAMALLSAPSAHGQTPASQPPTARPQPSYSPQGEAMTFRLVEGAGPRGATRWVSATGQIQRGSVAAFSEFQKSQDIRGLPLVLDSSGGSVMAAMAIGRQIRAAKMQTSIGRTISTGERETVRTADVRCASACVLVLMGGIGRSVSEDARIEVHMFSVELDAEGNKARSDPNFRDIEQAQRTMARHAVYVAEMGVAARYLEIMTEASFKGTLRRMTRDEIHQTQLAVMVPRETGAAIAAGWSISPPSASPQLIRTARLVENERMRVDHELVLECDAVRGFYWVMYRQQLVRFDGPKNQPQPVSLQSARIETGGWDYIFRAPPRGLGIANAGNDLWMRRSVPRKVFDDAVSGAKLDIQITSQGRLTQTASLHDASLARMMPDFARRCDARPGVVSVGPHPRR